MYPRQILLFQQNNHPPISAHEPPSFGLRKLPTLFQPEDGSAFIEGHVLPIPVKAYLTDGNLWTPFLDGHAEAGDRILAAKGVIHNTQCTKIGIYSDIFSALESGHELPRKLPAIPLKPLSSGSSISSCLSLISNDSGSSSDVVPAVQHLVLPLRPATMGVPLTTRTRIPVEAVSLSAAPPRETAAVGIDWREPCIFESIREVLQDDPEYVENIIRAVQHLPDEKQALLPMTRDDSTATPVDNNDGNGNDSTVQTSSPTGPSRSSTSNSRKTQKRKVSDGHDGDNGDGAESSHRGRL
ncbi:hypothetical protein QQS21_010414 [Conoideocrella luteorostrata]|uniref:Uncharacterized protein n=1 Tax=Conoideocrella luteorostrata TaxID=1105319 RepID=A0AAJ0CF26_9HYPO|nr:hypothetical protein QQS21_010414 [Conoideocrella luteorostrata]